MTDDGKTAALAVVMANPTAAEALMGWPADTSALIGDLGEAAEDCRDAYRTYRHALKVRDRLIREARGVGVGNATVAYVAGLDKSVVSRVSTR